MGAKALLGWLVLGGGSIDGRTDGWTDKQMDRWKISLFYGTLSLIGAAALIQPNFN